jgi:hypothetical protein
MQAEKLSHAKFGCTNKSDAQSRTTGTGHRASKRREQRQIKGTKRYNGYMCVQSTPYIRLLGEEEEAVLWSGKMLAASRAYRPCSAGIN